MRLLKVGFKVGVGLLDVLVVVLSALEYLFYVRSGVSLACLVPINI